MAESDNITPFPMGQAELAGLSQRLRARAASVLYRDQPRQHEDLYQAAAAIDELIRLRSEIRRLADEVRDETEEQHLRALLAGGAP